MNLHASATPPHTYVCSCMYAHVVHPQTHSCASIAYPHASVCIRFVCIHTNPAALVDSRIHPCASAMHPYDSN